MNRTLFAGAFSLGALAVVWVGYGFFAANAQALVMTLIIGVVYGVGAFELLKFRRATDFIGRHWRERNFRPNAGFKISIPVHWKLSLRRPRPESRSCRPCGTSAESRSVPSRCFQSL